MGEVAFPQFDLAQIAHNALSRPAFRATVILDESLGQGFLDRPIANLPARRGPDIYVRRWIVGHGNSIHRCSTRPPTA
jgi:hypothetical protein